ncbi:MAG: cytochrome-c peroxidase [Candidatus Binatia bacterium]
MGRGEISRVVRTITLVSVLLLLSLLSKEEVIAVQSVPSIGPLPRLEMPDKRQVELGKMLFFDERLSGDGGLSCARCHDPQKGWGDGKPLSEGYPGSLYFRNAKTILNVAYARYFYWEGRLTGADMPTQVRDSITETHFMNMDGRLLQERLKQIPQYVEMFKTAFDAEPSFGRALTAIAAFEKTIVSRNVPFDRGKLSAQAKKGLDLFKGKARCIQCHNGPYFSDGSPHSLGIPENPAIINEPLRHITMRSFFKFMGVPGFEVTKKDVGYFSVSKDTRDIGKFMTPTLREVSRTAPYMHNGVLKSLDGVIEFYNSGGGNSPNKSPLLKPLNLSRREREALLEFLKSLSGDEIVVELPKPPEYQLIKNWRVVKN